MIYNKSTENTTLLVARRRFNGVSVGLLCSGVPIAC